MFSNLVTKLRDEPAVVTSVLGGLVTAVASVVALVAGTEVDVSGAASSIGPVVMALSVVVGLLTRRKVVPFARFDIDDPTWREGTV